MQGSGRQAAPKPDYKHPAWETNERKRETNKRKWETNARKCETSQPERQMKRSGRHIQGSGRRKHPACTQPGRQMIDPKQFVSFEIGTLCNRACDVQSWETKDCKAEAATAVQSWETNVDTGRQMRIRRTQQSRAGKKRRQMKGSGRQDSRGNPKNWETNEGKSETSRRTKATIL